MKIEKNIPLPENIKKRFRIGPLPLEEMNRGDSLLIEAELDDAEIKRVLHSIYIRLRRFTKKKPEFKFSAAKDPNGKGMRIWRV
jgi:hypothetical protein